MAEDDHRHRSPIDHALDVFVYAPLGFVAEAPSLLPRFAKRGRKQVALVQALGLSALRRDPEQLDEVLSQHPDVRARLQSLGLVPRDRPKAVTTSPPSPSDPPPTTSTGSDNHSSGNQSGIDVDSLAILEYESLSASQVVPRLESLTPDELEAVRRYENGNRARRTILNKIAELQSSSS